MGRPVGLLTRVVTVASVPTAVENSLFPTLSALKQQNHHIVCLFMLRIYASVNKKNVLLVWFKQYFIEIFYMHTIYTLSMVTGSESKMPCLGVKSPSIGRFHT